MEIIGKIKEISPVESGTSANGSWEKQTLVVTTLDQDPQYVAFSAMGRRLEEVARCSIGQVVRVRFGVASRKVGERWFNDIQLWEVKDV